MKAYLEYGENCFLLFNGMWSIVIWDNRNRKTVLSNDRFGVKPLYYFQNENVLVAFSELKQFLLFDRKYQEISEDKINAFILNENASNITENYFKNVKRFQPSCFSVFGMSDWTISPKVYYSINNKETKAIGDLYDSFNELFKRAIELRLRSDVGYGIGLSGGLDSSMVLAEVVKQNKNKTQSFSAVFPGYKEDESVFMDEMIRNFDVSSKKINPLEEFSTEDFIKHIFHLEMPVKTTSYYAQWNVAKLSRRNGNTVLLVGQGADEVFAGYHHHFYAYMVDLLKKGKFVEFMTQVKSWSNMKDTPTKKVLMNCLHQFKLYLFEGSGQKSNLILPPSVKSELSRVLINNLTLDMLPGFLQSDDRVCMAFNIETRHPFLDYNLVDFGFSIPNGNKIKNGWQKHILRKCANSLPAGIRYRKDKKGFTAPIEALIRENEDFFNDYSKLAENFNPEFTTNKSIIAKATLGIWLSQYS